MPAVRILVPVDASEASAAALRAVVPLAKALQAECIVMAVAEPKLDNRFERFAESEHAAIVEVELAYLEAKAAWLTAQGVPASPHLATTPGITVPEAILDCAEENDVDLIAMATHGRSGLGRAVFGSVFQGVLRKAHVPILAIPQPVVVAAHTSSVA